ncbi:HdeA/HdeB family chaperone [Aestuariivirga litoralis]|nr:HdeA/HdeB family chaperone [Aestuariivirga litoralis]
MTKLLIAASAAALLTAAGSLPALAQSSSSSGAGTMTMPSITCRDLSGMDQQTARNVVFYLGGLNAAAHGSTAMNATTGSSGASATTADGSASGSSSDATGSTTAAGSSGTTASSGGSSASGAVMAQLPGFAMINADQIISTCQGQPDMQLSTLLGSGSAAQ